MKNNPQKKCGKTIHAVGPVICANELPCSLHSPTQPDTESDFKKYFEANLLDGDSIDDCGAAILDARFVFESLIDYFHQVEEKSYQRGLKETCIEIDKSNMEWLKGGDPKSTDFLKKLIEEGRQSAYREIMKTCEEQQKIIWSDIATWMRKYGIDDKDKFEADEVQDILESFCWHYHETVLSKLKSKLQ